VFKENLAVMLMLLISPKCSPLVNNTLSQAQRIKNHLAVAKARALGLPHRQ